MVEIELLPYTCTTVADPVGFDEVRSNSPLLSSVETLYHITSSVVLFTYIYLAEHRPISFR